MSNRTVLTKYRTQADEMDMNGQMTGFQMMPISQRVSREERKIQNTNE